MKKAEKISLRTEKAPIHCRLSVAFHPRKHSASKNFCQEKYPTIENYKQWCQDKKLSE